MLTGIPHPKVVSFEKEGIARVANMTQEASVVLVKVTGKQAVEECRLILHTRSVSQSGVVVKWLKVVKGSRVVVQ